MTVEFVKLCEKGAILLFWVDVVSNKFIRSTVSTGTKRQLFQTIKFCPFWTSSHYFSSFIAKLKTTIDINYNNNHEDVSLLSGQKNIER